MMKVQSSIPELVPSDPRVSVGEFTYGNPRFMLWTEKERIKIGSYCSIAEEVTIFGGGEHPTDWISTFPLRAAFALPGAYCDGLPATKGETQIGNDVWIGYKATILSGVSIGDGAIIGAGSTVTKSVPPYAIVAGNPAKLVRFRFTEQQIAQLMKIQWWHWSHERIIKFIKLLSSDNIDCFIAAALECDAVRDAI